MVVTINLAQDMTSLFTAGLLDEVFFRYLALRARDASAPIAIFDNSTLYSWELSDTDKFLICCKLSEKKLGDLDPFPRLRVDFHSSRVALPEEEVRRSQDTIDPSAYIFNAMQSEARGRLSIFIDSAFVAKWNIPNSAFVHYFPQIVSKGKERFVITAISPTPLSFSWSAIATHDPYSISASDLRSLFSLGLPASCYLFWILRFMEMRSPLEISLEQINQEWALSIDDSLKALASLTKAKVLSYEINSIRLTWKKSLSLIPAGELSYVNSLLRQEGKLAYNLRQATLINPIEISANTGIKQEDFYKALRTLKRKEILSFLFSGVNLIWNQIYEPAPTPIPEPAPTPTPTPTDKDYDAEAVDSSYSYDLIEFSNEPINDLRYAPYEQGKEEFANRMQSIFSGNADDEYLQSPDFGFDFPFNRQIFRSCFISSNSFLTFGYGSASYRPDAEILTNALFVCAGDRSMRNAFVSRPTPDSFRIRYDGRDSAEGDGLDVGWQVTLFNNGVIEVLVLASSFMRMGLLELRQSTQEFTRFKMPDRRTIVLYPRSNGSYTAHEGAYRLFAGVDIENDPRYSFQPATEQPKESMTLLHSGFADNNSIHCPSLKFGFPIEAAKFRSIYLSSNSYITFDYASTGYRLDSVEQNALFIYSSNRSIENLYISEPSSDSFRIRFEGRQGTEFYDESEETNIPIDLIWQATFFKNGIIEILSIMGAPDGLCELRGSTSQNQFTIPDGGSVILAPRNDGSYLIYEGSYGQTFLEKFPRASLAFSLRKLVQSNEELIIEANGFIESWRNQAIASNFAIQTNLSLRPKTGTLINGKKALEFDGVNDFLEFSCPPSQSFSIFILFQRTSSSINEYGDIICTEKNGMVMFFRSDNKWGTYGNRREQMANSPLEIEQPYLLEMHASNGSGNFYLNNQFDGNFTSTEGGLPSIGGYERSNECSSMLISEIIFYPFNNEVSREVIAQEMMSFYQIS